MEPLKGSTWDLKGFLKEFLTTVNLITPVNVVTEFCILGIIFIKVH